MNVDYAAYEGKQLTGRVETVLSRGELVIDRREFTGRAGHGQYIPRGTFRDLAEGREADLGGGHRIRIPWVRNGHLPVWMAAYGPKALAMAGRLADGFLLQLADPFLTEWMIKAVRQAAVDAGRDPAAVTICVAAPAYVGEDLDHAREQCRWFGGIRRYSAGSASPASNLGSAVPIGSRTTSSASGSYGVGSALTMISRAPCSAATPASEAAGWTWSDVPTARNTSAALATPSAVPSTCGSSRSPNITVADFRIPPHTRQSGSGSPAATRASASAIEDRAWQRVHVTARTVPCSSSTLRSGTPASWCSPSTFCVITRTGVPDRSSRATASCAAFGFARNAGLSRRICHDRRRISGSLMYASYVTSFSASGSRRHNPFGPR
ncbi:hypothetical protein JCM4914_14970 [Streptomyces platensis subsp. malvinus]